MSTIFYKGFKAVMSNGPEVKIEEDEINAVVEGAANGSFIKVRQGIINPSHIVSIVEDKERRKELHDDLHLLRGDEYSNRLAQGMRPLKDIFEDAPPRLASPAGG